MRHYVFGEILNGFQRTASGGFQVHDDVRHAVGLPLLPKLNDAFRAVAQVDSVVELGGGVRVFQEFDEICHAKGFPRFVVAQFFERVGDVARIFRGRYRAKSTRRLGWQSSPILGGRGRWRASANRVRVWAPSPNCL